MNQGSPTSDKREPTVSLDGVSVRFDDEGPTILSDLNLEVSTGELVVIAGPSGSGKSTLCSLLSGVIPHFRSASVDGEIRVCGLNTAECEFQALARRVASVFQNPETNLFAMKAADDVAFGPENLGSTLSDLHERVASAVDWTDTWDLMKQRTVGLSGGQKQRLAIASSLANDPELLILDEPTTDLDPAGKSLVVDTLFQLRERHGMTIVVVEHDLSRVLSIADRLVIMTDGGIAIEGAPQRVIDRYHDEISELGIRLPPSVELGRRLRSRGVDVPLLLNEGGLLEKLESKSGTSGGPEHGSRCLTAAGQDDASTSHSDYIVMAEKLIYRHPGKRAPALTGIDLRIRPGEFVGLVGPNGAGKSSLLQLMMGLRKPTQGYLRVAGQEGRKLKPHRLSDIVGYGFQNPDHQLFERTVWDECAFTLRRKGYSEADVSLRVDRVLEIIGLSALRSRHPANLSRGEKRRLAVATALVLDIEVLLLDEPTTGQDARTLDGLLQLVDTLNREFNTTIVMVTHDMDVVWRYASRTVCIKDGLVYFDGDTTQCLSMDNLDALSEAKLSPPLAALGLDDDTTMRNLYGADVLDGLQTELL